MSAGLVLNAGNSIIRGFAINRFGGPARTSGGEGIAVNGSSATGDTIAGNYVGTDVTGTMALGNEEDGIQLNTASNNTIGGLTSADRNVISGNTHNGLTVLGGGGNLIEGNWVGIDASGSRALGNSARGILLNNSNSNTIGGTTAGARNVISGNSAQGIGIVASADDNVVEGNYIGTDATGDVSLTTSGAGIGVQEGGGAHNTIGGTATGAGNVISGIHGNGIVFLTTPGGLVEGNLIGLGANGSALGNTGDGIEIRDSSSGVTVGGTTAAARNVISGNSADGINIFNSASGNTIEGNYIGTNIAGTAAIANSGSGVLVNGTASNTIGGTVSGAGNVISGNTIDGVDITGSGATGNVVEGNYVGTNAAGTSALGNSVDGVVVQLGASSNTIGGTTAGAGNVISGNGNGVDFYFSGTIDNLVEGNDIGTNAAGTSAIANTDDGVRIDGAANYNTIGGTTAAARNVISGNTAQGVDLVNNTETGNLVEGNYIGTNAAGTAAIANGIDGVYVGSGVTGATIGGTAAGAGNLISGNGRDGIEFAAATGDLVLGNFIGTNAADTAALPNSVNGISLNSAATYITIGGTTAGSGNVLSGNTVYGIALSDSGTADNLVVGNAIGTNAAGTAAIGNGSAGVDLDSGAANNTIGGTSAGASNIISGNTAYGVSLTGSGTNNNVVAGNLIGTNSAGTAALGSQGTGVGLFSGSNTIGGGNVISGNVIGIDLGANDNTILGNLIGTDVTGTVAVGNSEYGVLIHQGAQSNTIGGTTAAARNVISASGVRGVLIRNENVGDDAAFNVVEGNDIGTDVTGTIALGNAGYGIELTGGVHDNTIGGTTAGAGNLIAGNTNNGIYISGSSANVIAGNVIGTNAAGTAALANNGAGISIDGGSTNNTVGGTTASARNIISGNTLSGVDITGSGTTGNVVEGNYIGTNAAGTAALGNGGSGIGVDTGASGTTIGGTTAGAGNVISGNSSYGVLLRSASGNLVQGNLIGTNAAGTAALGNVYGVEIDTASTNNTIGGTTASARNVISGNSASGIYLTDSGTTGNLIEGNYVGTNAAGTAALANAYHGVLVNAANNTVGGTASGAGNVISGNVGSGVWLYATATGTLIAGNLIGTNAAGTAAVGNGGYGVNVTADGVTIGGTVAAARNVISGNAYGVSLSNSGTTGDLVEGNYVGTDATGTAALPNAYGIYVVGADNTIGGTTTAARNLISGNPTNVVFSGSGASGNLIEGNYVGTDASGTAVIAGSNYGVEVASASGNTIGGTTAAARNVIGGNANDGIWLRGATGTLVEGNYVGLNAAGTAALANGVGVLIDTAGSGNTVGGSISGAGNVISGNTLNGVEISGSGATANAVEGNYIGTDATGAVALGNGHCGVLINGGASNNFIGTNGDGVNDATEGNVISGNGFASGGFSGVSITDAGTNGNVVAGNFIGTNAAGTAALANGVHGVFITDGAQSNRIGTNGDGVSDNLERNVISGNSQAGVAIWNLGTNFNIVAGNYLGTDKTGTAALANGTFGVILSADTAQSAGPQSNRIGVNSSDADAVGERNIISGNSYSGVFITAVNTTNNVVAGNYIGTDVSGTLALPNATVNTNDPLDLSAGIDIRSSSSNTIGGTAANTGNLIAFNHGDGIVLFNKSADPTNTLIQGNTIVGNTGNGINILQGDQNTIAGNDIGTNAASATGLGNQANGILISSGSSNSIGGTTAAARNIISGNTGDGVLITGSGTTANVVEGNYIGTDSTGAHPLGNSSDGVLVDFGASGNTIGGTASGAGNVISGNAGDGIYLASTAPTVGGIVSFYQANGNFNDTTGPNNGAPVGPVTFGPGVSGLPGDQAFSFNGSDYVSVPDSPNLDITTAVTLGAWVDPSTLNFNSTFGSIIAKGDHVNRDYSLMVATDGSVELSYVSAGNIYALRTAGSEIPIGSYTYVAGVLDPTHNFWGIYVNGALVASGATMRPVTIQYRPPDNRLQRSGYQFA